MPKKKKQEEQKAGGAPLWMVTYSDMVTLLLCFFVMQLSMANFLDPGKVDAALESLKAAFSSGGLLRTPEVTAKTGENSDLSESTNQQLHVLVSQMRDVLSQQISQDTIRMTQTKTEIRIKMDDTILFRSGSTEIHPSAFKMISDITEILEGERVNVFIEGHADADGTDEKRNWELSALRSVAIINEMRKRKNRDGLPMIDGKFLHGRAMGEFHPAELKDGSSKWNRRVEIVIQGRGPAAQKAAFNVENIMGEYNGR